jgi:hypothetical protein
MANWFLASGFGSCANTPKVYAPFVGKGFRQTLDGFALNTAL